METPTTPPNTASGQATGVGSPHLQFSANEGAHPAHSAGCALAAGAEPPVQDAGGSPAGPAALTNAAPSPAAGLTIAALAGRVAALEQTVAQAHRELLAAGAVRLGDEANHQERAIAAAMVTLAQALPGGIRGRRAWRATADVAVEPTEAS